MNRCLISLAFFLGILLFSPAYVAADGNIRVSISRGNLTMVGARDATGQAFKMVPTGVPNQFELEGMADTTLNGSETLLVSGITNDIDIRIYSNESVILLSNGTHDSLQINGHLKIRTTSEISTVVILDSVFCYKTLSISTGKGNDIVINSESTFKWKTSIQTGESNDICYSIGCGTLEMYVDGGAGEDFIMVENNLFSRTTVLKGSSGNDYFGVVTSFSAETVELDGGANNDQFTFAGPAPLLTLIRMESEFPGTFGDLEILAGATSSDFAVALFLLSLL